MAAQSACTLGVARPQVEKPFKLTQARSNQVLRPPPHKAVYQGDPETVLLFRLRGGSSSSPWSLQEELVEPTSYCSEKLLEALPRGASPKLLCRRLSPSLQSSESDVAAPGAHSLDLQSLARPHHSSLSPSLC
mmetsp:Transcript_92685/g.299844  ORF Transcript_92685/g.299844 Transcript_92685/m.299844 type:complete len:133 (-) Transcript_92685:4784-5182(-)